MLYHMIRMLQANVILYIIIQVKLKFHNVHLIKHDHMKFYINYL